MKEETGSTLNKSAAKMVNPRNTPSARLATEENMLQQIKNNSQINLKRVGFDEVFHITTTKLYYTLLINVKKLLQFYLVKFITYENAE